MAKTKSVAKRAVVLLLAVALSSSCGGREEPEGRNRGRSSSPLPGATSPTSTATVATDANARCNPAYSPATLKDKQFAFDGEVTEIGERADPKNPAGRIGTAVFSISKWFKGGGATELTLQSTLPPTEGAVPVMEGPDLVVGSRYLVSGEGAFVGTCGFTRVWSQQERAEWENTFNS